MSQDTPSLFDPQAAPFVPWSDTSEAAARAIEPSMDTLRRAVLDWFRSRGAEGGTDEEGIEATGIQGSTWRPRRIELCRAGQVMNSGRQRRTKSGRQATVWRATQ